ncbi:hypothetical protein G184_gp45 [Erwinia phage ENT90]|uniref:Uncharacterized protein n=1 Tax=Erwinia phage ENT90 TaxID=947843 RepID=F1BUQ9_9CAUD|nr:hypothetical protein G184_gp45 [Erwinia phage ENT90]ADX32419.1 hypothetical protein [Erwinia phage ENT90]
MKVVVHLRALIHVAVQRGKVGGFALVAACGVGGAGNRAGHADADFLALHFSNRHDVDTGQKVRGLLYAVHQGLRDRRLHGEFFVHVAGVNAVQLGQAGHKGVKFKAGVLAHLRSCSVQLSGCGSGNACQQSVCAPDFGSLPVAAGRRVKLAPSFCESCVFSALKALRSSALCCSSASRRPVKPASSADSFCVSSSSFCCTFSATAVTAAPMSANCSLSVFFLRENRPVT